MSHAAKRESRCLLPESVGKLLVALERQLLFSAREESRSAPHAVIAETDDPALTVTSGG
jgi:hypothetical protein